ncbi:MAG TPA: bifunctional UDP-N-acetylglucosamine diphosphorylase/glucosamine-1-phosphate N-acetyltransferase GlmU [Burkholderiaceae bacterium]|nr:bifunctional UDP-N-acetylglucosamine diphosphorylase/glucosamine-1-phosphate N-acetyltransferase GlmU [Burkholderiaceae bacterium]
MNIVILAAGMGKRMRSALPKVLHPLAGRPMLAQVLETARAVAAARGDAARIVVVVGHGAEQVRAAFVGQDDVQFVLQEPQVGTGHAVQQAAPLLADGAHTLVLYGDVPLLRVATLTALLEHATDQKHEGVGVLTVRLADPTGYGRIVRDWHGNVLKIVEQKDASEEERKIDEVNTGILVAPTARLRTWLARLSNENAQREYYLTDVVAQAVHEGLHVAAVLAPEAEETLGVNSKVQLAQLERVAQRRIAQQLMDAGATLADPARIDVRGELTVGVDVFIDVGCVFEGTVHLADGARIGPHCVVRDCTIGAGTEVLGFCYLERARIGARARIGPFARTRPDVELADEVHIGNFVEVKNSRMGPGSKANHLSYVGDAVVGSRVNLGAGTIVANYDGANKHQTVIEDDVHTGSNSVLVAPLVVGAGATVGAGSTVSRQVPAGKLTVARARQTTIEGWTRPVKKRKS